jgi:membrane associated rhomboid family serine protease
MTPWVRRLLVATAVVYLLTITVFTSPWFAELFAFRPSAADQHPWTFLTYMFVHAGFLHLAFNLLMLFFFGPAVEDRMGGGPFIRYYVLCGVGGAALSFVLGLFQPVAPFVGASAAVFGVALAFAWYWPDTPVFVFPLPVPVKVKWLVLFLASVDLFLAVIGSGDGVAHFAHLGGLIVALVYLKTASLVSTRGPAELPRRTEARVLARPSGERARARSETPSPRAQAEAAQREVDRVLDKISASGLDSLTVDERRFLDEMSRQMKRD